MTNAGASSPIPGWYHDPIDPALMRWWTGIDWAVDVQRIPPAPAFAPTAQFAPAAQFTAHVAPAAHAPAFFSPIAPPIGYAPTSTAIPVAPGQLIDLSHGYTAQQVAPEENNGLAIAGFIVTLSGLLITVFGVVPLVGLVLGLVGLAKANKLEAAGRLPTRKGFAVASIPIGVLGLVFGVLAIVFFSSLNDYADYSSDSGTSQGSLHKGNLADPFPVGSVVTIQQNGFDAWEVTLDRPTLNADALVAMNPANPPAPAGMHYAIVPVSFDYIGETSGDASDFSVEFVAADGSTFSAADTSAVSTTPLATQGTLTAGDSATGSLVVPIPATDVDAGHWRITYQTTQYWFEAQ